MYHKYAKCVCGLDSTSGHGSVAGSCEHGSETSCYIIGNDVFSQLRECQFVKNRLFCMQLETSEATGFLDTSKDCTYPVSRRRVLRIISIKQACNREVVSVSSCELFT
jgi:hypothetical protein